jgi:hypothetical protein
MLGRNRLRPGDVVEIGGAPVKLAVNPRARRINVRLDSKGHVIATAPSVSSLPEAAAFARSRAEWIAERLNARPQVTTLTPGSTIPLRGRPTRLEAGRGRGAARLLEGAIVAGGEGEAFERRMRRFLRVEALADLSARTAAHAAALGAPQPSVALIDARTRWGSCTPPRAPGERGRIRYSWRLVLGPPWVLDYVAAHEVAHLAEANHGPRFWAVCERLYGDVRAARAWLKANGASLHAIA